MNIPSHIFDVDEMTAMRLANRVVSKRRQRVCFMIGIGLIALARFFMAMV